MSLINRAQVARPIVAPVAKNVALPAVKNGLGWGERGVKGRAQYGALNDRIPSRSVDNALPPSAAGVEVEGDFAKAFPRIEIDGNYATPVPAIGVDGYDYSHLNLAGRAVELVDSCTGKACLGDPHLSQERRDGVHPCPWDNAGHNDGHDWNVKTVPGECSYTGPETYDGPVTSKHIAPKDLDHIPTFWNGGTGPETRAAESISEDGAPEDYDHIPTWPWNGGTGPEARIAATISEDIDSMAHVAAYNTSDALIEDRDVATTYPGEDIPRCTKLNEISRNFKQPSAAEYDCGSYHWFTASDHRNCLKRNLCFSHCDRTYEHCASVWMQDGGTQTMRNISPWLRLLWHDQPHWAFGNITRDYCECRPVLASLE